MTDKKNQEDRDKEKVKLKCAVCNKEFELSYGRYRRTKESEHCCKKCRPKYVAIKVKDAWKNKSEEELEEYSKRSKERMTEEARKNLSTKLKSHYQSLSEEEKEEWSGRVKYFMSSLSPEEKEKRINILLSGRERWRESLTDDEREKIDKEFSKASKIWWETSTDEQKELRNQRVSETWKNKSEEEMEKIRELNRKRFYDKSEEEQKEIVRKMHEGLQNWFSNMSHEEKEEFILKSKEYYMNPDNLEKHRQIGIDYWNSLSEEEQKQVSIRSKEWWNSLTEDERLEVSKRRKEYWENLPEDEKNRQLQLFKENRKKWWDSLTDQERFELGQKTGKFGKEYWENIGQEEFELWDFNRSIKSDNFKITDTEKEFINLLNIEKIDYEFQYTVDNSNNEEFRNLFPINPYTGRKNSPHHKWDFLIKSKKKNILVDVDGSIHKPGTMEFKVPGYEHTVRESIDFNDSQRPYQTDGLDAYIIKCYDDKLIDDTEVVSVNDDSMKLTFKQFMSMLTWYNLA